MPPSCSSSTARADGSLLLDAVEAAYMAFRRRLRSIDQATSCDCNSCRLPPELPRLIQGRRAEIADRIAGLQALDLRLAGLLGHLRRPRRALAVVDGPCCEAADAVLGPLKADAPAACLGPPGSVATNPA